MAAILLLAAACQSTPEADTVPPQVHFVQPQRGDSFSPGVYTMKAVATDNDSVHWVIFFVYTEMLGIVEQRKGDTFSLAVDCSTDTLSAYFLRAFAMDLANNTTFDSVTVYVRR
jgi:hypothetical protein